MIMVLYKDSLAGIKNAALLLVWLALAENESVR